jgi:acetyltransferase-like isoleucine patch superfamily enzyme
MIIREILRKLVYARVFLHLKSHGTNVILSRGGLIVRPDELELGNNVFIARNFNIAAWSMKIGNNVMIGPNFLADCDDHIYDRVGVTMFSIREIRNIAPITIEDDVWIGGNVTLLRGAKVSEGCVIGAGSVVSNIMPPYSICYGVPCRPVKPRFLRGQLLSHLKKVNSMLTDEAILNCWERAGL